MKATIFTPNATPLALNSAEIAALRPSVAEMLDRPNALTTIEAVDNILAPNSELLAAGARRYAVYGINNAADYARPNKSTVADLTRLTGADWTGENQPYGPILIIEA